ncbi:MAG: DUF4139 domain-containing protein [Bacteroidia bacterium]
MKTSAILIFSLVMLTCSAIAVERPQNIKAPVTAVKVCLNSAQITHVQKLKIKPGISKFAFTGLSATISDRNIALRNIGSGELLSLRLFKLCDTTDIFSLPEDMIEVIRKTKDSLLTIEKGIEKAQFELEALALEKTMLLCNTSVIQYGKTLADLKMTNEYYRDRYTAVNLEMTGKQKEIRNLRKNKVHAMKEAFDVENSEENAVSVNIIIATVRNDGTEYSCDAELSYITGGAGWIPIYDIVASDKSMTIDYRAKILNNTGLDWNDMNISVSTADPSDYYSAPDLEPFYVTREDRQNRYGYSKEDYEDGDADDQAEKDKKVKKQNPGEEEINIPDREINFKIAKKYTFKAGTTPYFVEVAMISDLAPEFLYRCAPKKEEQVYRIARLKNWEGLDLIDGEASIYNGSAFVGKCYIRPSEIEDYLEIPVGVVSNVFVKHKLVNESSGKKVFGGGITATCNYEIRLKNGSNEKIAVEVLDQVPVSEDSDVKTEGVDFTEGGDKDATEGKITWKLELAPNTEKTLFLKYTVSYPRGYHFGGRYKKRAIRAKF